MASNLTKPVQERIASKIERLDGMHYVSGDFYCVEWHKGIAPYWVVRKVGTTFHFFAGFASLVDARSYCERRSHEATIWKH